MTNQMAHARRSGQSDIPGDTAQRYTLIAEVEDRPGSVDRVVGALRRRRANMQTLVLGRTEKENVVRITVEVNDSEVGIDQLVEQLRKVVDVQQVRHLGDWQVVVRELALVKVQSTEANSNEIIEVGQLFGAHAVDIAADAITLEITGSEGKIEELINQLRQYGIREVARSGRCCINKCRS